VNALAGRPVAIVTDIPGTTRDLLEATIELDGVAVTLIDSAGLRESPDAVERIGVELARKRAQDVDVVLWLSPADDPAALDPALQDRPVLHVRSKADLGRAEDGSTPASVIDEDGLDRLRDTLRAEVAARAGGEPALVTRERHRRMLARAGEHVNRAGALLAGHGPLELVSEELRLAARALDALVGRIDVDDVLGDIFSRFCIGK
jgi:tRNA modification GTPase